ncbi:MAG: DUF2330 domain-containing protein [Candidatus Altiarchaeales archaeon]|nr:DUF2330 domain-containing protein [Candidatus Altiarchaeales archaeon]MBD3415593.1 DUF2330 domain-containing protein [Candidatus Altiarchaeales archaeon]
MKWAALAVVLFLISSVTADGGAYVRYTYDTDRLSRISEDIQYGYIEHERGVEELRIAVACDLDGEEAFWILPLPAQASEVEVDILEGFPKFRGYDVESRTGSIVSKWPYLTLTQGYPLFGSPLLLWHLGVFNMGGGGRSSSAGGTDAGINIETRLEKKGLTVEVLEAESWQALDGYLKGKGVSLPDSDRPAVQEYIGQRYSFVVSWISNVGVYKRSGSDTLSLKARFPVEKPYYPLKLTSVYGEETVPIRLYLKGFMTPRLYDGISGSSKSKYYVNEDGMRYTKVTVNAKANSFKEDLWFSKGAPLKMYPAYLLSSNQYLTLLILYLFCSVTAALFAGLVVDRMRNPLTYVKIGMFNLLSIVGVVYATNKHLDDSKEKRDRLLGAMLAVVPVISVPALLGTLYLVDRVSYLLRIQSYYGNNFFGIIFTAVKAYMVWNLANVLIVVASILFYRKVRRKAALIPAAFFGGVMLIMLSSSTLYTLSRLTGSNLLRNMSQFVNILYIIPITVLPFMFLGGIAKLLARWRPATYATVFSVTFIITLAATSLTIMEVYPPVKTTAWGSYATGFVKIKPQLAATEMTSDGEFYGIFTNGAGATINVKRVLIETDSGMLCDGVLEGGSFSAGENFLVKGYGCTDGEQGDRYEAHITIDYEYQIGANEPTQQSDEGSIRGVIY